MTLIVIGHISVHAQKGEASTHNLITSITVTGVNIFILITGYFGIRLRWKSLLNIVGIVSFYSILSIILDFAFCGNEPGYRQFVVGFITPIFGHTAYWFANCYIILMLLSPALNIVRDSANNKQLIYTTVILILLSCITGFALKNDINFNGYNVMQFITIYFIGAVIGKFKIHLFLKGRILTACYIIATVVVFVEIYFNFSRANYYNNPAIIIAATSLFCLLLRSKFQSSTINRLAVFMFPIYLLQDGIFGFRIYRALYDFGVGEQFCSLKYFSVLIVYIFTLLASAIVFEHIRCLLMQKPLDALNRYLEKRFNFFD